LSVGQPDLKITEELNSTNVQILTPEELLLGLLRGGRSRRELQQVQQLCNNSNSAATDAAAVGASCNSSATIATALQLTRRPQALVVRHGAGSQDHREVE
jgi:hypothetical protein